MFEDARERTTSASPAAVWAVVESIGGARGWYSVPLLWSLRGLADRLVGGVGLRRGRRDPDRLYVGDALDFWRVEDREAGTLLRLRAEMRVPGRAWLEFHVEHDAGATVLRGIEGYGHSSQIHTSRLLSLSEAQPVTIIIVDDAERIEAFRLVLDELITEGLVVCDPVEVRRYPAAGQAEERT